MLAVAPVYRNVLPAVLPQVLTATLSDDTSVMLLARYTHGPVKLFAGYERYRWQLWNQKHARWYGALPGAARTSIRQAIATSDLARLTSPQCHSDRWTTT